VADGLVGFAETAPFPCTPAGGLTRGRRVGRLCRAALPPAPPQEGAAPLLTSPQFRLSLRQARESLFLSEATRHCRKHLRCFSKG
jgi:hypothetical protein